MAPSGKKTTSKAKQAAAQKEKGKVKFARLGIEGFKKFVLLTEIRGVGHENLRVLSQAQFPSDRFGYDV